MSNLIDYKVSPSISQAEIEGLIVDAWPDHGPYQRFDDILSRSLGHIGAYCGDRLVGFVYIAWDGESHAFLLDPMVRTEFRRQGIGAELVRRAAELAKSGGVEWMHVDFVQELASFYAKCGFSTTTAGLMNLIDMR